MAEQARMPTHAEQPRWFDRFSTAIAGTVARAWFFALCVVLVVIWAPSYLLFGSIDTWQLVLTSSPRLKAGDSSSTVGRDRWLAFLGPPNGEVSTPGNGQPGRRPDTTSLVIAVCSDAVTLPCPAAPTPRLKPGVCALRIPIKINTLTTIITFLLVALLQNTQSRADKAVQTKLNAIADGLADLMEVDPRLSADVSELRAAVGLEQRESS
jgi:low affinity Fe/Cu permease